LISLAGGLSVVLDDDGAPRLSISDVERRVSRHPAWLGPRSRTEACGDSGYGGGPGSRRCDPQAKCRAGCRGARAATANVAIMGSDDPAAKDAHAFIASLDEVDLARFRVVGAYTRYDEAVRNALQDARQKILAGFEPPGRTRENHLIWAAPGSGKTYFVQQVAASLPSGIRYHELNLTKCTEPEFRSGLSAVDSNTECLCLVDEVDAKPQEPWPYEALLPYLDAAVERGLRLVFVLAGSSGSSLNEIKQRIAGRPKGADLLSRIPAGHEYEIEPFGFGDRILVVLSQLRQAGWEAGREIRAVEKLGLYYVALNPRLANARQLREFAVRAVGRVPKSDDRVKYDHLFTPGDPENKAFWVQVLPVAQRLANTFVIVSGERIEPALPKEVERRPSPTGPAPSTPPVISAPRTCRIPRQLTSFIGRDREIAEVKRLLSATALLTLTGAGGCGKTRLALRVAADLGDQYPDGVWVAELAALSDPALVASAVATALDVPEQPGRALIETLKAYLQPRSLLLVLDNCEHLVTACAELAEILLRTCPILRILATSREPLGIPGEIVWRVPSLLLPDPNRPPSPQDLTQCEAVRLLVDRISSHQPGFAVTESNAGAVARLCNGLDGIPLAIELAAARVKILTVEQVADRLEDRFRLLTGGGRTALHRHQTLRAAMDWSYGLLSENERIALRRLSVFAGGWTLEAAEAVSAGGGVEASEVLDLLTQLVDKSLVGVSMRGGEARYGLLETVRQYGRDKLRESGEADDVRRRHLEWYLGFAEQAESELFGPREDLWGERLETEHDNLRSALEWGMTDASGEVVLRLAGALGQFWNRRTHVSEGRTWLQRALLRGAGAAAGVRAKALGFAGALARIQGDYARAAALGRESLDLYLELEDKPGIAKALLQLGSTADYRGDSGEAKRLFTESLASFQEVGAQWGVSTALNNLGEAARAAGDYDAARSFYEESLTVSREAGIQAGIANALGNLGVVALHQGNYTEAATLMRDAMLLMRRLGDKRNIIAVLGGLAGVGMARGKPEYAVRLLGAAEACGAAVGVLVGSADRAEHERQVASAHGALDKDTFASAWAEGRAMTLEQAIEYALAEH
jgi:predicted ATPase